MRNKYFGGLALPLLLALSACGGGGGTNSTPPPPSTTTVPTAPVSVPVSPPGRANFDTPEYRLSNAASAAGAITAYEAGASGQGIKLAFVDSGINSALSEFSGRIDAASDDVAGNRGVSDEDGHGTAVAAVAAAAKNSLGMHGVAFNATIVSLRADTPGSCSGSDGCVFGDEAIARGIDAARVAGARVVNLSLGGETPNSRVMEAMSRATQAGIILVISAGNGGETPEGDNPDGFALYPAQQLGNVIIAGSAGVDDGSGGTNLDLLSTFSNRAGNGADHYLTALGYRDRTINQTGAAYYYSGTSFSAPVISGAVALMAQAFPNLTSAQIIDILFRSADDLGASGTDPTFGKGRLNIARAFQPIGSTTLAGSVAAVSLGSNGQLPAAAGDGGQGSMGAVVLDSYSRAFIINLSSTLARSRPVQQLASSLRVGLHSSTLAAGAFALSMNWNQRSGLFPAFQRDRIGIGPEDARTSRLVAASAMARVDDRTGFAIGFGRSSKELERQLAGSSGDGFLIARDIVSDPGFIASHDGSVAMRREIGRMGMTLSSEQGTVWNLIRTGIRAPSYRISSVAFDKRHIDMSLSLAISRLEEKQTVLGGRMSQALGGEGSDSWFVDAEARRDFNDGLSAGLSLRRGWTHFGGGAFTTAAYSMGFFKTGVLERRDRLNFRLAQPLRVVGGGFSLLLPTAYEYATGKVTSSRTRLSFVPSGREIDAEITYGRAFFGGWIDGNLFMRRQPGHIAMADADVGSAIRFRLGL
ncbi:S8 family peptidase [Sphingobium sp.]|uniref:S8 family peptidase n=1 Tax=Sphingobium sp. TaxID=1912891 RepID=UPI0028BEF046|nr:S8 family peptidase [Sphingobium sp.]